MMRLVWIVLLCFLAGLSINDTVPHEWHVVFLLIFLVVLLLRPRK